MFHKYKDSVLPGSRGGGPFYPNQWIHFPNTQLVCNEPHNCLWSGNSSPLSLSLSHSLYPLNYILVYDLPTPFRAYCPLTSLTNKCMGITDTWAISTNRGVVVTIMWVGITNDWVNIMSMWVAITTKMWALRTCKWAFRSFGWTLWTFGRALRTCRLALRTWTCGWAYKHVGGNYEQMGGHYE